MVTKNLTLVLRKLRRERGYAVINVVGLAVALMAVLLIYSHVVKEWNTDRFHKNSEHIYRVIENPRGEQFWESWMSGPMGPYVQAECPGIEICVRVTKESCKLKKEEDKDYLFTESVIYTDHEFFEMFTFPIVKGEVSKESVADWVVISEEMAVRCFGDKNPIGETLWLKSEIWREEKARAYRVVALMANMPASSTLQADIVADFSFHETTIFDSWGMHGVYTYFQLTPHTDIRVIEEAIPRMIEKNYHYIKADEHSMKLQPLGDIYFDSEDVIDTMPHGSKRLNLILCGITLLILMLASCNYWMIKLAGIGRDSVNLAILRCFGAGNSQLKRLLLVETFVHAVVALFLAVCMVVAVHPWFVGVISFKAPYPLHFSVGEVLLFLLLFFLFTVGVARLLSYYVIRRLNRDGIKNTIQVSRQRLDVKKVLLVVQLSIFIALFFGSVVLIRQLDFIRNRQLGFDSEHVIQFMWRDWKIPMATLRSEFLQHPDILSVSNGDILPQERLSTNNLVPEKRADESIKAYMLYGDAYFIDTYRIGLVAGRDIDERSYPADPEVFYLYRPNNYAEILINRKFAQQLGRENPIGTILFNEGKKDNGFQVVGVLEDFHYLSLYQAIEPAFLLYDVPSRSAMMLVRYRDGKRTEVLEWLKKKHEERFPEEDFFVLEYNYSQLYEKDIAIVKLIHVFTLLALFIGGMGIFAFSMFMVENRMREIALRKVNGGDAWQIVGLLNRDFMITVFWACVIALPVAHYAIVQWLEGFAYKTELSWWIYVLVMVVSMVFVCLITTWQTWRAATVNPIRVLKDKG